MTSSKMRLAFKKVKSQKAEGKKGAQMAAFCLLTFTFLLSACGGVPVSQSQDAFPSPVAYVAVAPMAEPTATPTLVPLATSTELPPTTVPRRAPADTSATVGLWSDQLTETQPFTGYLDLVVGPAAFNLQPNNAALIGLTSRQFHIGFLDNSDSIQESNPEWLLFDSRKRLALSTRERGPLVNISNETVKDQIAKNVANWVAERNYDGIILNDVGVDLIRTTSSPIYTGTKTFTDAQRKDAVENLLRAIRGSVPDKIVIVGGYAWRDGTAYAADSDESSTLGAIVDGISIDEFLRSPISDTTAFRSEAAWKRDVDYLSEISADNRIVLVTTRLTGADATPELSRQWLSYSVASYLLGKNGAKTYFQFGAGNGASLESPEFTAPLGAPVAAYKVLDSKIYQRDFANGTVLVNPTGDTAEMTLEADYKTLSGTPITGRKVTMTAHTGVILLKL